MGVSELGEEQQSERPQGDLELQSVLVYVVPHA